ncbi:hypothetical protein [Hymenobacter sp. BT18]|uniref:hypothetical protein n=1 Tax=Hymenobacter sp. BT18 TaxID=2835648 RepID=UPI001E4836D1|nr:hypothetical protein [Hymenobacter sp. BT18]
MVRGPVGSGTGSGVDQQLVLGQGYFLVAGLPAHGAGQATALALSPVTAKLLASPLMLGAFFSAHG